QEPGQPQSRQRLLLRAAPFACREAAGASALNLNHASDARDGTLDPLDFDVVELTEQLCRHLELHVFSELFSAQVGLLGGQLGLEVSHWHTLGWRLLLG